MKEFFETLWDARGGIFVFVLCIFVLLAGVLWFLRRLAVTFQWGAFRKGAEVIEPSASGDSGDVTYLLAKLLAKLITDFRHLLALLLVLIFSGVLIYAIYEVGPQNGQGLTEALQAVMSTLGGLVGSIVGYYFGESAGRRSEGLPGPVPPAEGADTPQQRSPETRALPTSITAAPGPTQVPAVPQNPSSPSPMA